MKQLKEKGVEVEYTLYMESVDGVADSVMASHV